MAYADLTGEQAHTLLVAAHKTAVALSPNWTEAKEAAALLPTYTKATAADGNDVDSIITDLQSAVNSAAPAPSTEATVKDKDALTLDSKKYTFTVKDGKISAITVADA